MSRPIHCLRFGLAGLCLGGAVFVLAPVLSGANPPARIMPLGDSITYGVHGDGNGGNGGYRVELWRRLVAENFQFDSVGSLQSGPEDIDRDHEGQPGWTIENLLIHIDEKLALYQPRLILLQIGINDFVTGASVETALGRMNQLLDKILDAAPDSHLLVGSLLVVRADNEFSVLPETVQDFNRRLPELINGRAEQGKKIAYLNLQEAAGFSSSDFSGDGLHPNQAGYDKLAAVWHPVVRQLLQTFQPPTVTLTSPGPGSAAPAPASIQLTADATVSDGRIREVEFFQNGVPVGTDASAPFEAEWQALAPGAYTLVARATDVFGSSTTSPGVTLFIQDPPGVAVFYRAINLNGPPLVIDGHSWEGGDAPNLQAAGTPFVNQNIPLDPPTDDSRAAMIRSSIFDTALATVTLTSVPAGLYRVFLYVWEDNISLTARFALEGIVAINQYQTGPQGRWERLGPWYAWIPDGTLEVRGFSNGDALMLSGIEVAKIEEGTAPVLRMSLSADGVVLRCSGPAGRECWIETSSDLEQWTGIGSVSLVNGEGVLEDQTANGAPQKFYRAQLK